MFNLSLFLVFWNLTVLFFFFESVFSYSVENLMGILVRLWKIRAFSSGEFSLDISKLSLLFILKDAGYLLFLVFFVLLSQQRFWSVSGTKLIKFQWVPYTPEGVCVGKAWCSAWPHSRFQSQTCPESAGRQAFWWGLEVKVNMLFFSEWSHSPQKQLRCLLLQEALMSFTPVWITYVAATSTPSPKQFFLLL